MSKKMENKKPKFLKYLNRVLLLIVICLVSLIVLKANPSLKDKVYKTVFQDNLSFAKINEIYQKYFGSSLPFKTEENAQMVSSIALEYTKTEDYKDGVKLTLDADYVIPSTSNGLVIFAGEKEGYGNTIVVQKPDNIEIWYGNLESTSVNLYDYVKQGQSVGKAKDNILYMVFIKEGKTLDYKKYI